MRTSTTQPPPRMTSLRNLMIAGMCTVLGGASAVALTACNSDDVFANDDDGQVNVSLTEHDLKPGRAKADAGKVSFEVHNDGDRLHAFAVQTTNGVKSIKSIQPGDTESLTVELSDGRYRMYDPRGGYRNRGVSGTLVVTSADRDTVTERTVERTVIEKAPDVVVPETEQPEVQEPEVQQPPAAPAPPPARPAPPTVTQTVVTPPPVETTP